MAMEGPHALKWDSRIAQFAVTPPAHLGVRQIEVWLKVSFTISSSERFTEILSD